MGFVCGSHADQKGGGKNDSILIPVQSQVATLAQRQSVGAL